MNTNILTKKMPPIYKYFEDKNASVIALPCLMIVAAIFRYMFVASMELPEFDPWRHLQLLKNIQTGKGFTLFDGQPYIWYSQIWYYFASVFGPAVKVQWISSSLSVLSTGLLYIFLLKTEKSLSIAIAGGLMMAAFSPIITFTSGYGPESFALFLMLLAFTLATNENKVLSIIASGLIFGMAIDARMNFLFSCIILIPILKNKRNYLLFASGVMTVLLLVWWKNYLVINSYDFIFTWDGLATKSSDYNLISILAPQLHPAVAEATKTLHSEIVPLPLWFIYQGQLVWGTTIFMAISVACLLFTKRLPLIIAGLLPFIYFILFDKSLSSNFFRIYLGMFPVFFIGIAVIADRVRQNDKFSFGFSSIIWILLIAVVIFSGNGYYRPSNSLNIENVTPTLNILTKEHYMVNSGAFHPESLIYRFPDKKFIGMPYSLEHFDDFSRQYPKYTSIIWHQQFSVQNDLLKYLLDDRKYTIVKVQTEKSGLKYLILEQQGQ